MSTATDEPQAEPVEPEEEEGADVQPAEEDEEASAAQAAQQEGSAEIAKRLERETARYHRAVSKILDTDMSEHVCPTCDGFGFYQGAAPEAPAEIDLVHPDNMEECESCNGYGLVITGSKNPDHVTTVCTACSARGYVIKTTPPPPPIALATPAAPVDQPVGGQWVPGRGFIPYGQTEPLPNTEGLA